MSQDASWRRAFYVLTQHEKEAYHEHSTFTMRPRHAKLMLSANFSVEKIQQGRRAVARTILTTSRVMQ